MGLMEILAEFGSRATGPHRRSIAPSSLIRIDLPFPLHQPIGYRYVLRLVNDRLAVLEDLRNSKSSPLVTDSLLQISLQQ